MGKHLTKRSMVGALLCATLGLSDFFVLRLFGARMWLGEHDITAWTVLLFAANFAMLGFVIGRLMDKGAETRAQSRVIESQYETLAETQRQLVQSEKMAAVGRLAGGVAHEVRNPLGVIRSSAQLVIDDLEPEGESHEAANFILQEVDRLNAFVSKLLDFTRPLAPEPAPFSVEAIAAKLQSSFSGRCSDKGIAFDVDLGAEREVLADGLLIEQLLHGLLVNAIQAAPKGGKVAVRSEPGTVLVVEVADDGPGIEPTEASQVFDPFFTTKADGTGLGLAMARKIAEVHGGSLEVVDGAGLGPDGRGACFRLRLAA